MASKSSRSQLNKPCVWPCVWPVVHTVCVSVCVSHTFVRLQVVARAQNIVESITEALRGLAVTSKEAYDADTVLAARPTVQTTLTNIETVNDDPLFLVIHSSDIKKPNAIYHDLYRAWANTFDSDFNAQCLTDYQSHASKQPPVSLESFVMLQVDDGHHSHQPDRDPPTNGLSAPHTRYVQERGECVTSYAEPREQDKHIEVSISSISH